MQRCFLFNSAVLHCRLTLQCAPLPVLLPLSGPSPHHRAQGPSFTFPPPPQRTFLLQSFPGALGPPFCPPFGGGDEHFPVAGVRSDAGQATREREERDMPGPYTLPSKLVGHPATSPQAVLSSIRGLRNAIMCGVRIRTPYIMQAAIYALIFREPSCAASTSDPPPPTLRSLTPSPSRTRNLTHP